MTRGRKGVDEGGDKKMKCKGNGRERTKRGWKEEEERGERVKGKGRLKTKGGGKGLCERKVKGWGERGCREEEGVSLEFSDIERWLALRNPPQLLLRLNTHFLRISSNTPQSVSSSSDIGYFCVASFRSFFLPNLSRITRRYWLLFSTWPLLAKGLGKRENDVIILFPVMVVVVLFLYIFMRIPIKKVSPLSLYLPLYDVREERLGYSWYIMCSV